VLAAVLIARGLVLGYVRTQTLGTPSIPGVASLLAELAQPLHALHAALRRTIRWRSRRYHVRANDDFAELS
jgi:ceramide glucosyltransferase